MPGMMKGFLIFVVVVNSGILDGRLLSCDMVPVDGLCKSSDNWVWRSRITVGWIASLNNVVEFKVDAICNFKEIVSFSLLFLSYAMKDLAKLWIQDTSLSNIWAQLVFEVDVLIKCEMCLHTVNKNSGGFIRQVKRYFEIRWTHRWSNKKPNRGGRNSN